jgi:hypothetical protein
MKYTFMNIIWFRCNLINLINIEANLEMEDIIAAEWQKNSLKMNLINHFLVSQFKNMISLL